MKAIKKFFNSLFNKEVKSGKLIKVDNKDHKMGESSTYIFVWVEDQKGKTKALLFTENEIKNAELRAFKNPEDLIEL
jgi:hypothetical protein